jgi:hypothetical protein
MRRIVNVRFPKPQDRVTALFKVCIARPISFPVGVLNRPDCIDVNGGIAVPEITVPLHDYRVVRQERVNNEFAADNLLSEVADAEVIQKHSPRLFKLVSFLNGGKAQFAVDAFHVFVVIAAIVRAVFNALIQPPFGSVKQFVASGAANDVPAAAFGNRALSCFLFGLRSVLPNVRAFERTEARRPASPIAVLLSAVIAGERRATVATLGEVGTRREHFAALLTNFG